MDSASVDHGIELMSPQGMTHAGHFAVAVHDGKESGASTIVELRNIHKTYLLGIEGVPALRGVTVSITKGEFIVILGKSGGGKTTMLNVIGTIDKPSRGDMFLCDRRITSKTTDADLAHIRLHNLGFVFQTFNLLPTMTAIENVMVPMVMAGLMSSKERHARARELLGRVGMSHRLDHFPSQLSGGEQQRVTIARALANRPELLLLDEPTGDLDSKNSEIVMKLLVDLNAKEGVTMVMVTHDVGLKQYANRVIRMVDGKISHIETVPEDVRKAAVTKLNASPWVQAMVAPLSAPRTTFADAGRTPGLSTVAPQPKPGAPQRQGVVSDILDSGSGATYTNIRKPGDYHAKRYEAIHKSRETTPRLLAAPTLVRRPSTSAGTTSSILLQARPDTPDGSVEAKSLATFGSRRLSSRIAPDTPRGEDAELSEDK